MAIATDRLVWLEMQQNIVSKRPLKHILLGHYASQPYYDGTLLKGN